MKVFYTASFYGKDRYQEQYNLVLEALEDQNVDIISPEKESYQSVLSQREISQSKNDNHLHYLAIKKGISIADAVIIEASFQDLQLGYEAASALQHKKPVLCLSIHEDFSQKIHHPLFHGAKYSQYSIAGHLEEFLQHASNHRLSERFNLFLSPSQIEYLKTEAEKIGLNQSQYLRRLLDQDRLI